MNSNEFSEYLGYSNPDGLMLGRKFNPDKIKKTFEATKMFIWLRKAS